MIVHALLILATHTLAVLLLLYLVMTMMPARGMDVMIILDALILPLNVMIIISVLLIPAILTTVVPLPPMSANGKMLVTL
jgi:predicted membrane protein